MQSSTKSPVKKSKRMTGNVFMSECPTRNVLDHIFSRWGSLILVTLLNGTLRFSELFRKIGGVSEKMLAQSLRALESDGFVLRTVHPTIPPSVEYSLTRSGVQVAERLKALTTWVETNLPDIMSFRENKLEKAKSAR